MARAAAVGQTDRVVIRFAGDSGDGIQLTGGRFAAETAAFGNGLATLPSFPAEIRAPQGSLSGVSSFQVQFADHEVLTPGDRPDVLVAMNPAALRANVADVSAGGVVIVDSDEFTRRNLEKVGYDADPTDDDSMGAFQVVRVPMGALTRDVLKESGMSKKDVLRCRNMFALGLVSWMYHRSTDDTERRLRNRFRADAVLAEANVRAFRAGWNYGETTEALAGRTHVAPADFGDGTYRQVTGNTALAYGIVAAGELSGLPVFFGGYPITPASDVLHELAKHKDFGVVTFQAEDEIAGVGAALGASYGGALGVTCTSGPGLTLKSETIGLAVMTELPLVVIDVQRGGPSTGLPTRTEQTDLLQAMFGRNGECPVPVLAPRSPADCFAIAIDAARIALTYRTPVIVLSDGSLANGSEPWRVPELVDLPGLRVEFASSPNAPDGEGFWPYSRDPETLARDWAIPGTAGLEHRIGGLEKTDGTGDISYDPDNHERMVVLRQAKVDGVAVPEADIDDPSGEAEVIVVGWGSTFGPIGAACRRLRAEEKRIAHVQLRSLNPLPAGLGDVLQRYRRVVVVEMNLGQLALLLRGKYDVDVVARTKVSGIPFGEEELCAALDEMIRHTT